MSVQAVTDTVPFAVPPTFEVHRGVLPRSGVEEVRAFVARVLGNRPAAAEGEQDQGWAVDFRTLMAKGELENPRQLIGVLKKSSVPELCRAILGPGLAYSVDKSLIRDFDPGRRPAPAPMHFDAHVFGPHIRMLTVWVPLTPVGADAPGLSIARRPHWPLSYWNELAARVDDTGLYRRIDASRRGLPQDEVLALARNESEWPLVEPRLDVGDVMIFDHQHIHGTQTGIEAPARRMSMEVRVMRYKVAMDLIAGGLQQLFGSLD